MVAVEARDFAQAFVLIRQQFPHAILYGRRVRWQSDQPERDVRQVKAALAGAGLAGRVEIQPLSMEDTFVHVLRAAGLGHG